jgi:ABC-2 type transport system permease protein
MISALLYLQFHSIKNRIVFRIKRMRQPKYLFGAIVGGTYFYFYFFRYFFGFRGGRGSFVSNATPQNLALFESIGALIFLALISLGWIFGNQRAALTFTEAEVAFLFPAPVSRRGLIHFKLLRSQIAILFTTLLLTLITNRFGGHPWIRAAGWWIILSTLNLHFLGSSFARTMLLDRGITNWQRRLAMLALLLGGILWIIVWARRTIPAVDFSQFDDFQAVKDYIQRLFASGPAPYLLFPFRLIVRPYLSPDVRTFVYALPAAVLLIGLHYIWVIRSNVAFEEASVEASRKLTEKIASIRSGNFRVSNKKLTGRRAPFVLNPIGPQPIALFWKNLIGTGFRFTPRLLSFLVAAVIFVCVMLRRVTGGSDLLPVIAMITGMLLVWSLLLGPQLFRQDLRKDLALADMLKLYPMRGWQIVLGELLTPVMILSVIQWLLLVFSLMLFSRLPGGEPIPWPLRIGAGFGATIIIPILNLITIQIPNAAVLLFPAWFQAGKEGAHGIEATGQRLIFLLGSLFVFIIALIPALVAFGLVLFLVKLFLDLSLALPIASVGAALVLAIEAGLGVRLLGWLFDRFDVCAELG